MKRRSALKNLGLITGGILLFPSCNYSDEKATIALNKLKINSRQETLIKEIVETILPEGEIPGGISLGVNNFVWVMIDDCTSKEKQEIFLNGLNKFRLEHNNFHKLEVSKRLIILQENTANSASSEISYFLKATKELAIQGYMNSEYILTEQMPYKLVPGAGSYETCKTINPNEKINIHA